MEEYKQVFLKQSADIGALFFKDKLFLKDGRPTPYFYNTGAFAEKASYRWDLAKAYAGMIVDIINKGTNIDIIFGPSYKASLIAGDTTLALLHEYGINLGCCYDRKEEKTHGEASGTESRLVGAKLFDGCNIYIVDDVATSMTTKRDSIETITLESQIPGIKTQVAGIGVGVDREQVGPVYDSEMPSGLDKKAQANWKREHIVLGARGEDAIGDFVKETNIPVTSILGITEAVNHLYESQYPLLINDKKQPMDEVAYNIFNEYMEVYGVERE